MPRIKLQTAWSSVVVKTILAAAPLIMPIEYRRKIGFIAGIPSEWLVDGRHKSEKLRSYLIRGSSKRSELCENTFPHRRERNRGTPHMFSSLKDVLRDGGSIAG